MPKSKPKSLPSFDSLNALVDFFNTHDLGEYWDQMPEARFDVNIKQRKHLVAIDDEISAQVARIATSKNVSSEKLINSWLKEQIRKVG